MFCFEMKVNQNNKRAKLKKGEIRIMQFLSNSVKALGFYCPSHKEGVWKWVSYPPKIKPMVPYFRRENFSPYV